MHMAVCFPGPLKPPVGFAEAVEAEAGTVAARAPGDNGRSGPDIRARLQQAADPNSAATPAACLSR